MHNKTNITKEDLNKILEKHQPGFWTRSWNFITRAQPSKINHIAEFLTKLNSGPLSDEQINELKTISGQTDVDDAAKALFIEIHHTLSDLMEERARLDDLINKLDPSLRGQLLRLLTTENYYSSRTHDFIAAMQEIMPNYFTPRIRTLSENGLACLYLALSIYYLDQQKISYFFIGKVSQSFRPFLAKQYNKLSIGNQALVAWGLDWTIQLGLTFAAPTVLQFILNYTMATGVQSLASKVFQSLKGITYIQSYAEQYPKTVSCLDNLVNDAGFVIGIQSGVFLNNQLARLPTFFESKPQEKSSSHHQEEKFYSHKPQKEKFSTGYKNEQTHSNNGHKQQNYKRSRQPCPINLNSKEKDILKIKPTDTCKEVRQRYRKLTLLCHPDKNGSTKESTEQTRRLITEWETYKSWNKC